MYVSSQYQSLSFAVWCAFTDNVFIQTEELCEESVMKSTAEYPYIQSMLNAEYNKLLGSYKYMCIIFVTTRNQQHGESFVLTVTNSPISYLTPSTRTFTNFYWLNFTLWFNRGQPGAHIPLFTHAIYHLMSVSPFCLTTLSIAFT